MSAAAPTFASAGAAARHILAQVCGLERVAQAKGHLTTDYVLSLARMELEQLVREPGPPWEPAERFPTMHAAADWLEAQIAGLEALARTHGLAMVAYLLASARADIEPRTTRVLRPWEAER